MENESKVEDTKTAEELLHNISEALNGQKLEDVVEVLAIAVAQAAVASTLGVKEFMSGFNTGVEGMAAFLADDSQTTIH